MKHKVKLNKAAVAVLAIVTLLAVSAVPQAAFAGEDRPSSKGGSTADLALSARSDPEQVNEGEEFWVVFFVDNNGPDSADGRKLTMQFDSSKATFIEANGCRALGNTVTCTVPDYYLPIFSGDYEAFTVVFRALSSGGTFTGSASVTSQARDPNRRNNTTSVSVPIVFEYECWGSVGHTAKPVQETPHPRWMHSCRYPAESLSAREIRLEFLLEEFRFFYGRLEAEVRSEATGTVVAKISAVFVDGRPVGLTTSTTGTLPAGDWTLTVSFLAVNQTVETPGTGGPGNQYFVYAPLSYGTYAAVVTEA